MFDFQVSLGDIIKPCHSPQKFFKYQSVLDIEDEVFTVLCSNPGDNYFLKFYYSSITNSTFMSLKKTQGNRDMK